MITRPKAAPAQSRSADLRLWHPACMEFSSHNAAPKRKRLRSTRQTERKGVNALRSFLENQECVVQEVDTANDFGKDLLVDLTTNREITGETIAVQVKSGSSFSRGSAWGIPASSVDLYTWFESSIPIYGVVFDPAEQRFHWMNLSSYVHEEMNARYEHKNIGKPVAEDRQHFKGHFVPFPEGQTLDTDNWDRFTEEVKTYLHRFGGHALLDLMAEYSSAQLTAVHDCFALGRGDARALLLVRHTINRLSDRALLAAVHALSHCASHPDIAWSERNWIPQTVRDRVKASFVWSPEEMLHMIHEVELAASEGFPAWERGGYGQSVIMLFWDSPDLCGNLHSAVLLACQGTDADVAFRTLAIYQYFLGIKNPEANVKVRVSRLMKRHPMLTQHDFSSELMGLIEEFGWVDIF